MSLFKQSVRLAALAALVLAALRPGGSRAVSADRPASAPAAGLSAAGRDLKNAAQVPAPTLLYPSGGAAILAGETITITWQTNGAPPTATYALEYTADCTITPTFTDTVEHGANGWTVRNEGSLLDWTRVISKAHSPVTSWFASNDPSPSNQFLISPDLAIGAGDRLFFTHQYNLEEKYDGGVVELSDDGVFWFDLGLDMVANGYNTTIDPEATTLLAGAPAFSGVSAGWQTTEVDLNAYAGKTARIRFLQADDAGNASEGWWVDDIMITKVRTWVPIATSAPGASSFLWTTPAIIGADYCVRIRGQAADHDPSAYVAGPPFSLVGGPGTRAWLPMITR